MSSAQHYCCWEHAGRQAVQCGLPQQPQPAPESALRQQCGYLQIRHIMQPGIVHRMSEARQGCMPPPPNAKALWKWSKGQKAKRAAASCWLTPWSPLGCAQNDGSWCTWRTVACPFPSACTRNACERGNASPPAGTHTSRGSPCSPQAPANHSNPGQMSHPRGMHGLNRGAPPRPPIFVKHSHRTRPYHTGDGVLRVHLHSQGQPWGSSAESVGVTGTKR